MPLCAAGQQKTRRRRTVHGMLACGHLLHKMALGSYSLIRATVVGAHFTSVKGLRHTKQYGIKIADVLCREINSDLTACTKELLEAKCSHPDLLKQTMLRMKAVNLLTQPSLFVCVLIFNLDCCLQSHYRYSPCQYGIYTWITPHPSRS